jgi:hypothetical protein
VSATDRAARVERECGQRRWSPVTIFHGGARLGSPDFALNGAPGVKSTGLWIGHHQCVTRDPPRAKAGLRGGGSRGAHDDGGGSARWRITGARVPATGASLGPRHLAQDDRGDDVVLTEGLNGPEEQRKLAGDEGRAAGTGGARGGR